MNNDSMDAIVSYMQRKQEAGINWANYAVSTPAYADVVSDSSINIDDMFADELAVSKNKIYEITAQIAERENIKAGNLSNILNYQMLWESKLMNEERQKTPYGIDGMIPLDETIVAFEEQKRKEELLFWKDVSYLRLKLIDVVHGYMDSKRKMEMLTTIAPIE